MNEMKTVYILIVKRWSHLRSSHASYLSSTDKEFTAKSVLTRKSLWKWWPGAYTQVRSQSCRTTHTQTTQLSLLFSIFIKAAYLCNHTPLKFLHKAQHKTHMHEKNKTKQELTLSPPAFRREGPLYKTQEAHYMATRGLCLHSINQL